MNLPPCPACPACSDCPTCKPTEDRWFFPFAYLPLLPPPQVALLAFASPHRSTSLAPLAPFTPVGLACPAYPAHPGKRGEWAKCGKRSKRGEWPKLIGVPTKASGGEWGEWRLSANLLERASGASGGFQLIFLVGFTFLIDCCFI